MKNKYTLIFGIIVILGFMLFGYMHEAVHVAIFKSYNIESDIAIEYPNLVTIPHPSSQSICSENCILAHNINESISYTLAGFYIIGGVGLLIIIVILESISNKLKSNNIGNTI